MKWTTTLRWLGLALLGVAVAAAVSFAASRLVSQQIGLASQPISAGNALAPVKADNRPPVKPEKTPAQSLPPPAVQPPALPLESGSLPKDGEGEDLGDGDADD